MAKARNRNENPGSKSSGLLIAALHTLNYRAPSPPLLPIKKTWKMVFSLELCNRNFGAEEELGKYPTNPRFATGRGEFEERILKKASDPWFPTKKCKKCRIWIFLFFLGNIWGWNEEGEVPSRLGYAGNVFSIGYPQVFPIILDGSSTRSFTISMNSRNRVRNWIKEPGKWIQGSWKSFPTLRIPWKFWDGWGETRHCWSSPSAGKGGKEVEAKGILEMGMEIPISPVRGNQIFG